MNRAGNAGSNVIRTSCDFESESNIRSDRILALTGELLMSHRFEQLSTEFKSTVVSLSTATHSAFDEVTEILEGETSSDSGSKASDAQMALSRLLHNIEELRCLFDDLEKTIREDYS